MENISNLKKKSDELLIIDLKGLVARERETLTKILHYLREIEIRKIFLARGFPSLFEWMRSELGYSEGAASRRIAAMRLIQDVPEVEQDIQSGEMSLSVASQVQSYFRKDKKKRKLTRQPAMPKTEKQTLINSLKGTSIRECERKLIELAPETNLPPDKVRPLTEKDYLIQFKAHKKLMIKIERLQNLLSHQVPKSEYGPLFEKAVDLALEKLDPECRQARREKKEERKEEKKKQIVESKPQSPKVDQEPSPLVPAPEMDCTEPLITNKNMDCTEPLKITKSEGLRSSSTYRSRTKSRARHLPQPLRDYIWKRDQSRCQFRDPKTGRICGSREYLEIDHRYPFSLGGESTPENLRLMCRGHNLFRWEEKET